MAFYNNTPGVAPTSIYDIQRKRQADDFDRAMQEAQQSERVSQQWGQNVRADQARQDNEEAVGQQLAMTPGVSAGGSTATHSVGSFLIPKQLSENSPSVISSICSRAAVGTCSEAVAADWLMVQRSTSAMRALYQFMNRLIDRLIVR